MNDPQSSALSRRLWLQSAALAASLPAAAWGRTPPPEADEEDEDWPGLEAIPHRRTTVHY